MDYCNNDIFWEVCIEAKMNCDPYSSTRTRANRVLALIHADLMETTPRVNDKFDKKYIFMIIDNYSRYAVCFVVSNKSDVLECFKIFVEKAHAMHSV